MFFFYQKKKELFELIYSFIYKIIQIIRVDLIFQTVVFKDRSIFIFFKYYYNEKSRLRYKVIWFLVLVGNFILFILGILNYVKENEMLLKRKL